MLFFDVIPAHAGIAQLVFAVKIQQSPHDNTKTMKRQNITHNAVILLGLPAPL